MAGGDRFQSVCRGGLEGENRAQDSTTSCLQPQFIEATKPFRHRFPPRREIRQISVHPSAEELIGVEFGRGRQSQWAYPTTTNASELKGGIGTETDFPGSNGEERTQGLHSRIGGGAREGLSITKSGSVDPSRPSLTLEQR